MNHSKIFFGPPSRAMKTKQKQTNKQNKWDSVEVKSLCTKKETINKVERLLLEWEEIFGNKVTDKGLIYKIYKQLNSSCSSISKK